MGKVYGTPVPVVSLSDAAAALETTEADVIASLAGNGKSIVIVGPNHRGVRPADLAELSPTAAAAVTTIRSPHIDQRGRDLEAW